MNGVHDLGGMHGFGPIVREENEPVFHSDWERRIFALVIGSSLVRLFNTDEFRHAIERMEPAHYLASSYYEHWLAALGTLLVEKGVVSREQLAAASATKRKARRGKDQAQGRPALLPAQAIGPQPVRLPQEGAPARFKPGDRVVARNLNPVGHIRLPRYVRGRRGTVERDHGVFGLPDHEAHGLPPKRQHVYSVSFSARELWGSEASEHNRVLIDLWDDYLDPA